MAEERVLIVSSRPDTAETIAGELRAMQLLPCCCSAETAMEAALEEMAAILIFLPASDADYFRLALEMAAQTDCAVMAVGKRELLSPENLKKLQERGVLLLERPLTREKLQLMMESALCFRRRMAYLRQGNAALKKKMKEIHWVERAKFHLMQTLGMTEAQAHRFIEKQAMDARQTKAQVAQRILRTYENQ